MLVKFGNHELEMGGKYLTELRSSNDIADNPTALKERMEQEGYILIRGFHKREEVLAARQQIIERMNRQGIIDTRYPLDDAVIAEGKKGMMFGGPNKDVPAYLEVVNSDRVMNFFEAFLGGPVVTYDYKWLRAVGSGGSTGAHYDIVYMGRGTKQVYTLWSPFGDIPIEMGTLAMCLGSQHFHKVRETYGQMDVDRDRMDGWFSKDPVEIVDKFGGQWATTHFEAGDAIFFGMYVLHASTENTTNRYRISCDTRYQLASEPVDDRWIGETPKGHTPKKPDEIKDMMEARKQWGVS